MDHESEIRLVESHSQRRGGHQGLHLVGEQGLLGRDPLGQVRAACVRQDPVPGGRQSRRGVLGVRDGQAVDDAAAGQRTKMLDQPGQPPRRRPQFQHPKPQGVTRQGPAQREHLVPADGQLLGDVGDHPLVGRRGGGQHRDPVRQLLNQGTDPPVVGTEVVAPVADAVGLVDHHETRPREQMGQLGVAETGVDQALRGDQEDVEEVLFDGLGDLFPVGDVRRVDGGGPHPGAPGGLHLVAHQRQQRGDDQRGTGARSALQQRGYEVDRRFSPAGALHHQGPPAMDDECLDGLVLPVAEDRILTSR